MRRVSVFNAHRRHRLRKLPVVRYVRHVLSAERKSRADVAVVFIDTRFCIGVNRKFLGRPSSTDVISFSLGEGANLEGEIYVNVDKAREQARRYGVTCANEVARLVIHGTLHLLGYDDRTPQDARRMKAREDAYVKRFFGANGRRSL